MFRQKCLAFAQNSNNFFKNGRNLGTTSKSKKWDLFTALLIERRPIISPAYNDLEKKFQTYLQAVEFEKSLKCHFEIELENEAKTLKQNVDELNVTAKQTAQDFIEACKDELNKFKPAEKITAADKTNDLKSPQRKLDKSLIFLLNEKIGEKSYYILPQTERLEGESLRKCAERALNEKCGSGFIAQFYGNAPFGFYKYKYPRKVQEQKNAIGAKLFIYYAAYVSGQLPTDKEFKWLDKSELDGILPSTYKKSIMPLLFD